MRIVTHADDCGLTDGITTGILDCAGSLAGASVMAGGDCPERAARALEASLPGRYGLPVVGVHLNLLEGRCLLPPDRLPHRLKSKFVLVVKVSLIVGPPTFLPHRLPE